MDSTATRTFQNADRSNGRGSRPSPGDSSVAGSGSDADADHSTEGRSERSLFPDRPFDIGSREATSSCQVVEGSAVNQRLQCVTDSAPRLVSRVDARRQPIVPTSRTVAPTSQSGTRLRSQTREGDPDRIERWSAKAFPSTDAAATRGTIAAISTGRGRRRRWRDTGWSQASAWLPRGPGGRDQEIRSSSGPADRRKRRSRERNLSLRSTGGTCPRGLPIVW